MTNFVMPGADMPHSNEQQKETPASPGNRPGRPMPGRRQSPENFPNPLPGVDPQQTPGSDHPPAERIPPGV